MKTWPAFCHGPNWFRVKGYGMRYVDHRKHPPLYSERYGYRRGSFLHIGPHCFGLLRPEPLRLVHGCEPSCDAARMEQDDEAFMSGSAVLLALDPLERARRVAQVALSMCDPSFGDTAKRQLLAIGEDWIE